jgi:hypothetical protein
MARENFMTHTEALELALHREEALRECGLAYSKPLIENLTQMLDAGDVAIYEHMENAR